MPNAVNSVGTISITVVGTGKVAQKFPAHLNI